MALVRRSAIDDSMEDVPHIMAAVQYEFAVMLESA